MAKVAVVAEALLETARRVVKRKVLPLFSTLSTQMVPPISSTRRLAIARPRPVPPNLRVVEESAWEKFSKMVASFSCGMPMPVSVTRKRREPGAGSWGCWETSTSRRPESVNFMALPRRLRRIWRRRRGSPMRMFGRPGRWWCQPRDPWRWRGRG